MRQTFKKLPLLLQRLRRDTNGIAAVEFAILAPILITLIIGAMETGRVLYTRSSLQSGLEMAGRYAMVHPSATQSELQNVAFGNIQIKGSGGETPTLVMATENGTDANFLVLTASIPHKMMIPLVTIDDMTLTAQTIVPISS